MLRIAFAGTPEFAVPALALLAQSTHTIVGVLTQPDRPAGRGRKLAASPVKQLAQQLQLPVAQPAKLASPEERAALTSWRPDLLAVAAYGLILPPAVLELPRLGCLNIHGSLLPRWRGAAPIQRAILAGDDVTGITIMQMEAGLDTGPMLAQRSVPIDAQSTTRTLHDQLALLGARLLLQVIDGVEAGAARATPQPHIGVTYAAKIDKSEARIDWQRSAAEIARRVRAFDPWPVAETSLNGTQLRLWSCRVCAADTVAAAPRHHIGFVGGGVERCLRHGCAGHRTAAAGWPARGERGRIRRQPQPRGLKASVKASAPKQPLVANVATQAYCAAARAVFAVTDLGCSADDALTPVNTSAQRAAVRAMTLGTLRWYLRIARQLDALLTRPRTPPLLRALLSVAMHQLEYSRSNPALGVSLAVEAARALGFEHASGLVNAVLRRYLRDSEALNLRVDAEPAAASAHPPWLVRALTQAWPHDVQRILEANNAHPPMTLRVNLARVDGAQYLSQLQSCGMAAQTLSWLPSAVTLTQPVSVTALPGFEQGLVSVQDAGAQLAARLLDVRPGDVVLDACAAPGGKSGALLELVGGALSLQAVDIDPARTQLIESNLRRLGYAAQIEVRDLADAQWPDASFDRILVDVPCSSVGVIRRHPDIKLLRRPEDVAALCARQSAILANCFNALRPDGRLLYCTCSMLPEENEQRILALLASQPQARECRLPPMALPADLRRCRVGWQLLPGGAAGTDGFYYACLTRTLSA